MGSNRPAALILSDNFHSQFLSPYLKKYKQDLNLNDKQTIINAHRLDALNVNAENINRGSILSLGFEGETKWYSFEVINKSSKNLWYLDFGHYFNGRFGMIDKADIFITNFEGANIFARSLSSADQKNSKDKFAALNIPKDGRSIVVVGVSGHAGIPTTLPLKIVSIATKDKLTDSRRNIQTLILFALIGMVFFFAAFSMSLSSGAYLYFAAYYGVLALLAVIENQIFFVIPFLSSLIVPICLTLLALAALIVVKIFWDEEEESKTVDIMFKGLFACLVFAPLIAMLIPDSLALPKTLLFFGGSLLTLALIPVLSLIQAQHGRQDAMPFVFGWFVLLCGLGISAIAVSGFMPPLSTTLNAFWYALVPQALFFAYAVRSKVLNQDNSVSQSKTLEIVESEQVSKYRQSKESAEQERLMKVIEQERKVMGELRKSEARRADEMRVAKDHADEANAAKSAFLAVVSHEIRTPMSGIMGMVRMLLDSGLDKQQKEYAQTIQESSDAMLALLNDILDFEKVQQGKMDIESISIDLPRLIRGVATLMNGHATQKKIELITDIDEDLPRFVKGDPTRLRQILLNLTGNAIKFTNEGSVTIMAKLMKAGAADGAPHEIYLGVADSGVGISKEGQKKIFEAFSQADQSVSRKFGGTGLGLAISKGLVEAMNSDLHINSNEGEGSTFFFTLQMPDSTAEQGLSQEKKEVTYDHHKKAMNLLIVDDNEINLKVIKGFLDKSPHNLDTALSAEEAMSKIDMNHYDAVFMDIELPEMNGDNATQKLRTNVNPLISELPIIALTGNILQEDRERYLRKGMNDILTKPVKPSRLNDALDKVASGHFVIKKSSEAQTISPETPKEPAVKSSTPEPKTETLVKPSQAAPIQRAVKVSKKISAPIVNEPDKNQDKDNEPLAIKPIENMRPAPLPTPPITAQKPSEPSKGIDKGTDEAIDMNPTITPKAEAPDFSNLSITNEDAPKQNEAVTTEKMPHDPDFDKEILDTLKGHLSSDDIQDMLNDVFIKSEEINADLIGAFENHDTKMLYAKAHELKGMMGNFGLKKISAIAGKIESASKAEMLNGVKELIDDIPTALATARAAADDWLRS